MPRHGSRRGPQRGKRPHDQQYEQEEAVDDLAVAMMHAQAASEWCGGGAPEGAPAKEEVESTDEESSDSDDDASSDGDAEDGEEDKHEDGNGNVREEDTDADPKEEGDAESAEEASQDVVEAAVVDGTGPNDASNVAIKKEEPSSAALTALSAYDSDDDADSDIDLAEQLARMEGDEDDLPATSRRGKGQTTKSDNAHGAPRTEHEINPFTCPTEQLEKLNVGVAPEIEQTANSLQTDDDGALIVNEEIKKKLSVTGTVRSFIVEQRTVVVDSFVPFSLQSSGKIGSTLDEGSLLVVITKQVDGQHQAVSLTEAGDASSLQVLGKIMEVFGPIQRPLYAIRLPDPPKAVEEKGKEGEKEEVDTTKDVGEMDPVKNADEIELEEDPKDEDANAAESKEENCNEPSAQAVNEEPKAEAVAEEEVKTAAPTGTEEQTVSKVEQDPWSPNGKLTRMLQSYPNAPVYSLADHAKLIDTDLVIKKSGRGCDASNMYDEEVGPGEQQYFSDDEQERMAKRGNRKPKQTNDDRGTVPNGGRGRGGGSGRGSGRGRGRGRGHSPYNGFGPPHHMPHQPQYQQWQPQPFQQPYPNQFPQNQMQQAPPNAAYYPQGYPPPQQGMYQQQYPPQYHPQPPYGGQPYQYPPQGVPQGYTAYGAPPPPPPPPASGVVAQTAASSAQYPQQRQNPQSQVPDSDTVYYDYAGS